MKVVQINATCGVGSTGKICVEISRLLGENGIENHILFCEGETAHPQGIKCATPFELRAEALKARLFGNWGFGARRTTKAMIAHLERIRPDIVHLHNIHGHTCHLEMLFSYLRKKKIKTFWTFHDCWAFTGYCTYFTLAGCDKWKTGCENCIQKRKYSWLWDKSKSLYARKKALLAGLDLTVIAPSEWMGGLVRQSFWKEHSLYVIPNGIDLSLFHPTESDIRERYNLENRYLILGVAFGWGRAKGPDVFTSLAARLGENYRILLVGTDEKTEKALPCNIIPIRRTQDQRELAALYTAADVFVNPTREDNYPTVNLEALACGTPAITFGTGGSPESIDDTCGVAVPCDDMDALMQEIVRVCENKPFSRDACLKKAREFDAARCFYEYIKLYGVLS